MKKSLILFALAILATGVLAGCGSSTPTSDGQMDRYKENEAKAEKLGAKPPPGQNEDQSN